MIIDGTYDYPGQARNMISPKNDFNTQEFEVASLAKGTSVKLGCSSYSDMNVECNFRSFRDAERNFRT